MPVILESVSYRQFHDSNAYWITSTSCSQTNLICVGWKGIFITANVGLNRLGKLKIEGFTIKKTNTRIFEFLRVHHRIRSAGKKIWKKAERSCYQGRYWNKHCQIKIPYKHDYLKIKIGALSKFLGKLSEPTGDWDLRVQYSLTSNKTAI